MDNAEYLQVQSGIAFVVGLVRDMPIAEFIEAADKADAIGPFVDPTLWRAGHERLQSLKELGQELKRFQDKAKLFETSLTPK